MAITRQRIDAQGRPIGVAEVVSSSTITQPVGRGYFVEVNGVRVYKPPRSTVSFSPTSRSKSYTTTRQVALPEKEYAKYEGPEEETARIPLKGVFGSTPQQRQTYVREVENFNRQVKQEKQKVTDYNKEVEAWNKSGRFTTVTETRVVQEKGYNIDVKKTDIQKTQAQISVAKPTTDAIASPSYKYKPTEQFLSVGSFLQKKEEKPTFFGELKSQAVQRYTTIPKAIGTGFKDISTFIKTEKPKNINQLFGGIYRLSEPSLESLKKSPKAVYEVGKSAFKTAIATQPFRKDFISGVYSETRAFREELKTPQRQAELVLTAGELAVPYVISKTPQAITSARYKLFGTKVTAESLYSKTAMTSPRGLDLTYNPEKTLAKFKEGFGKTKELPGQFVGVSQTRATSLGSKVLIRSELKALGIKQGSEPGLFVSPKGAGQTGFLGISDDITYKLTADPRKIFGTGQPTTFQIGFKEIGTYPKSILKAPLSQSQLEAYQISQASKSKALITRMSSLGTKLEPEVIIPVTSKLKAVKTPLYYTEFKGTVIPIKTVEVLGTGAGTKGLTSLSTISKGTKAYESLLKGERYLTISPSIILPRYSKVSSSLRSSFPSSFFKPLSSSSISKPITEEPVPSYISESSKITTTSSSSFESSISKISTSSTPSPTPSLTRSTPSRPSLTYTFRKPTKTFITRPVIPKDRKQKEAITGEPAYDVFIKVGKNWVNKTNGKRNIYSAIDRGSTIVDNTTAKSFKVKKGTGIARIYKSNLPYNINKFYTPSKTRSARLTGAYIEKSQYAIDTPGERRGLSVAKYLRGVKIL